MAPRLNTVSEALSTRTGSCAALVALALLEHPGSELRALVLRDHVLLVDVEGTRYFEALEQGRPIGQWEFAQHPAGPGPEQAKPIDGVGFLAYYTDNLAVRLANAGQREVAVRGFELALEEAPNAGRIRFNYGSFLISEDPRAASVELRRAIALGWETSAAYTNLGAALWAAGDRTGSVRALEQAIALDGNNRTALEALDRTRREAPGRPQ